MASYSTNEFKGGLKIMLEGDPCAIIENEMTTLKSTPDAALPGPVLQYLDRATLQAPHALVLPLTVDASDRALLSRPATCRGQLRARAARGAVLLRHPAIRERGGPARQGAGAHSRHPRPRRGLGILELQDLGDVTLQAHLGSAAISEHTALYREAIRLIAAIQRRGRELTSDQYVPYGIAFDVAKLTWELEFFLKHFVVAYRGAEITPDDETQP